MADTLAANDERATSAHGTRRWAWGLAALATLAFAVTAIEFTVAVRADRPGWWAFVQALLTSEDYSYGRASVVADMYPHYRALIGAMSLHTMLGGTAMGLAVLQFVPWLRRRHRRLHRALGALVIVAVIASMAGSLAYLARTPLARIYASPGFGLVLWALALATLAWTGLAIASIRRRDFRSHMGFMALMMANLLTAPMLRVEWALLGMVTPFDMHGTNQGATSFLGLLTTLMMALWMTRIGDADLPARARRMPFGPHVLAVLRAAGALAVVHEALLAPFGIDAFAQWRTAGARLPAVAALWGLPVLWLLWRLPGDLAAVVARRTLAPTAQALAAASAVGALLVGLAHSHVGADAIGLAQYWLAIGVTMALLLAASRRAGAPWAAFWVLLPLVPALWPLAWGLCGLLGLPFEVAAYVGAAVGSAAIAGIAFMTAFSLIALPARVALPSRPAN